MGAMDYVWSALEHSGRISAHPREVTDRLAINLPGRLVLYSPARLPRRDRMLSWPERTGVT